jgi:Putative zinc-finger
MTEVPKIVVDRLRAAALEHAASEPGHPDPDLLTAFAEQALSAAERDGVLAHLALCGDCREVVALARPPAETAAAPIAAEARAVTATFSRAGAPAPHKLFAWPTLRWAALAAGIAVAASVLLMHPGKLNQATLPSVNSPVAKIEQPASSQQIPAPSTNQLTEFARTREARSEPKSPSLKKEMSEPAVTVVAPETVARAKQGVLLAQNKPDIRRDDGKDAAFADKPAPGLTTGAAAVGGASGQPIPGSVSEVVEVTAASPTVQAEVSSEDRLTTRNAAPAVEKAKPAVTTEAGQLQSTVSSAAISELPINGRNFESLVTLGPTWTIKAGVLRKSVDSGQSWQNALRADHPLRCYASHNQEVWAGGKAGTLFHSVDGGVTWVRVQPSVNGHGLSSDINRIDLRGDELRGDVRSTARSNTTRDVRGDAHGPTEIVLTTRNHETWSSSDSGRTWTTK